MIVWKRNVHKLRIKMTKIFWNLSANTTNLWILWNRLQNICLNRFTPIYSNGASSSWKYTNKYVTVILLHINLLSWPIKQQNKLVTMNFSIFSLLNNNKLNKLISLISKRSLAHFWLRFLPLWCLWQPNISKILTMANREEIMFLSEH